MKVLIIQQKMIGDVLTSSILFEAIRTKYPDAELHYLINSHTYPVIKENPYITKIVFFSEAHEKSKLKLLRLGKELKKENYDIIIDVYSKFSSNILTWLSEAKLKVSKHKWYTSFLYTHTYKEAKKAKTNAGLAIENRLQMLSALNISSEIVKPKIYLTGTEKSESQQFLESNSIDLSKPLFMIGVLGSGDTKTYPFAYMAKIIDTIVSEKPDSQILFNYIPKQINDAKAIFDLCNLETKKHIHFNVFGKSLRNFLAITSHCTALIGNEGGATNMAKALNIPTFTIFSPWIKKDAWNMFDNSTTNVSVNLRDVSPHISNSNSLKQIKKGVFRYYDMFKPDGIIPELKNYLEQF